jgi:hypothetical protein
MAGRVVKIVNSRKRGEKIRGEIHRCGIDGDKAGESRESRGGRVTWYRLGGREEQRDDTRGIAAETAVKSEPACNKWSESANGHVTPADPPRRA